jgi:deoxycytidine triphosphate deaminase
MFIGAKELLQLVKEKKLMEGLCEREMTTPEGAGFDIRIGELYEIKGKGFMGVTERETPEMELVAKYEEGKTIKITLEPQVYYLMKTIERVNMPQDLLAISTPRSTLFRSGVYIFGGQVPPGYKGELSMGIYNFRNEPFGLEMGARVLHIMFSEVRGESNLYRGQWQGGRVTTSEKEKQI